MFSSTVLSIVSGYSLKVVKLEIMQSFCCKVAQSVPNFRDGWLCKGDGLKEVWGSVTCCCVAT